MRERDFASLDRGDLLALRRIQVAGDGAAECGAKDILARVSDCRRSQEDFTGRRRQLRDAPADELTDVRGDG